MRGKLQCLVRYPVAQTSMWVTAALHVWPESKPFGTWRTRSILRGHNRILSFRRQRGLWDGAAKGARCRLNANGKQPESFPRVLPKLTQTITDEVILVAHEAMQAYQTLKGSPGIPPATLMDCHLIAMAIRKSVRI